MDTYVRLLGPPRLRRGEAWLEPAPGRASAALYYAASKGGWVSRDELLYLFWPDVDEALARGRLRQLLTALRRQEHAAELEIERTRLRWPVPTDLARFSEALDEGNAVAATGAYGGELLEGFRISGAPEFDSWLQLERELLRERWRDATLSAAAAHAGEARHADAVRLLERLARTAPFDEEATAAWLEALFRAGRPGRALEVYAAFRERLACELGAEPAPATAALVERGRAGAPMDVTSSPVPGVAPAPPARPPLPLPATPFVGRAAELARLGALLDDPDVRLITVLGPGGIGKTRLALEAARTRQPRYPAGAAFVPFAAAAPDAAMADAVADALGLAVFGGGDVRAKLLDYLAGRELLLVLDNLEHLADRSLISEILTRAPRVTLLATSRARLELHAEQLFELGGMGLPEEGAGVGAEPASDAERLFLRAARRVRPQLALDPAGARAVARICRAVAGLPLALELAAGWLRSLPPAALADEVAAGLDLLETEARDVPERHRSVRAAFDRSWSLLGADARAGLARLGVFAGAFSREAAVAVAEVRLRALTRLLDRSLLQRRPDGRFELHPLLRQYARERLERSGDDPDALEERHGRYFLVRLERHHRALWGRAREGLAGWRAERDDIRTAWLRAAAVGDAGPILRAAAPLKRLYELDGRHADGLAAFETACARLEGGDPAALGAALVCRSALHAEARGIQDLSGPMAERGLALLGDAGPDRYRVVGLLARTWYREVSPEGLPTFPRAIRLIERALALAETLAEPERSVVACDCLHRLSLLTDGLGEWERTRELVERMLERYRAVDYQPGIRFMTEGLGWQNLYEGHPDEAERWLERALALARRIGTPTVFTLGALARVRYEQERFADARALCLEVLRQLETVGDWTFRAVMTATLGRTCTALGEHAEAERRLAACLRFTWEKGRMSTILLEALTYLAELRAAQGRPEAACELAALCAHHPVTRAWNRAQAEALLDALRGVLPAAAYAAALGRGRSADVEAVAQAEMAALRGSPIS